MKKEWTQLKVKNLPKDIDANKQYAIVDLDALEQIKVQSYERGYQDGLEGKWEEQE